MIKFKTKNEIKILSEGGKILASILEKLIKEVKPGVTTGDLEEMANKLIKEAGGRPSFKNHAMHDARIFPSAICTSINEEIVHAPSLPSRELKFGDIIGIDIGMQYPGDNGCYTDIAKTIPVGEVDKQVKKLIEITKQSLKLAIKKVKPGNNLNDIGQTIQEFVERQGFAVVRELVGHGVGYDVHEEPQVPNFNILGDKSFDNVTLEPGLIIAIEPMVNMGGWRTKTAADGFTIVTKDKSLSAHFEHTVAVVEGGCKVLTAL
ncbi:MAG: type I methionyl aminopeptidase [Patescibacteria group bacterium]